MFVCQTVASLFLSRLHFKTLSSRRLANPRLPIHPFFLPSATLLLTTLESKETAAGRTLFPLICLNLASVVSASTFTKVTFWPTLRILTLDMMLSNHRHRQSIDCKHLTARLEFFGFFFQSPPPSAHSWFSLCLNLVWLTLHYSNDFLHNQLDAPFPNKSMLSNLFRAIFASNITLAK
jgi:hypothetical protein